MQNLFLPPEQAAGLIRGGAVALFAGSEDALRRLPTGCWIGGTTPYFMTQSGGVVDATRLFCTILTEAADARIAVLDAAALPKLTAGRYPNGFSTVLLPAFSDVHRAFALDGPGYPGLCDQPLMGWVTGVKLADLGHVSPKVFDGRSGEAHDAAAVVMHVSLPAGLSAGLDIVNLFAQGSGPDIVFPADGFTVGACTVNGVATNLADYLLRDGVDLKLPLVADCAGAQVNVAVRAVDPAAGTVSLYAPVAAGETYRIARPVPDYARQYALGAGTTADAGAMLACNCILNFLYADLEGKTAGGFVGPVTFGEIAYVLLNQTLVRLALEKAEQGATAGQVSELA